MKERMMVLVIGAAGGFGGGVARALVARGHHVRALMRPGGRRPDVPGAEVVEGDALDRDALGRVAVGMDAIVFGFHVPYRKWNPVAIDAARVTAAVAADTGATVLFPGNVYGLGPDFSRPLREDAPREAPTRKGEIRNEMERLLCEATDRGARAIVLRAGDYLDPRADNTWFEIMVARAISGGAILDPGRAATPHAWAYLPDVVQAGVRLLEKRHELSAYEVVHFEGFTVTSSEIVREVQAALGAPARVRTFPWWLVRALGLVWPLMRELADVRYLWEEPVLLDGEKLRRLLPSFRMMPLSTAVRNSIDGIRDKRLGTGTRGGQPRSVPNEESSGALA